MDQYSIIDIPNYKKWQNIKITKNQDNYDITYYYEKNKYNKFLTEQQTLNFLIQCLFYNENRTQ